MSSKTLAIQIRVKLFNFFARPLAAGAPRAGGGGGRLLHIDVHMYNEPVICGSSAIITSLS